MGTCYSTNTVRKSNSRKPSSCFGSLCNDSQSLTNQSRTQPEPENFPKIKSIYNIYEKNDKLNNNINELIAKYNENIMIKKINYIQLYNLFMNFIYDFTKSNYIICDTREKTNERNQIFLKKFSQINFTIRQIEMMNEGRSDKFRNFLKNKKIIFILKDESSLDILEKYIIYFIANNYNNNIIIKEIYILNEYIQTYKEDNISNSYLEYLYYFIDEDTLYNYSPKILINCQDIKSSNINYNDQNKNNAFVFINSYPHIFNSEHNKNNNINKFDINYLCDKNIEETDIFLNFMAKFKIHYIFNFISSNKKNINKQNIKFITNSEEKRNKIKDEEKKSLIKQKNVTIPKDMAFEQFYGNIKNELICLIEEFKNQVIQNNCILIQFDDNIDILFKYKLLYIIAYRITGLSFDDIFNYLNTNFFDIENNSLILSKKDDISNLLI
jgi:hypothetical protein